MIPRYALPEMASLWSEEAKFDSWLQVEIAVCEHYAAKGRIPREDLEAIKSRARIDVPRIEEIERTVRHDVIAFTTQLAEVVGPASRFVHLGLTSSDVVDTGLALRMVRAADMIGACLARCIAALETLARRHARTVMMGRTHGMHAEPTTFGLKVLVWHQEFVRHAARLERARHAIAVGKISGAVGTAAHTGLELENDVMERLGLRAEPVATQVVQRDRHAEFLTTLAVIGGSIEKIATEVRHLQRPELRELEEPFSAGQKGSSAMPHKRNPVTCEQMTGLSRVLRANAVPAIENIALWGERDISHSSVERVVVPDSCCLAHYLLNRLEWLIAGLRVNESRMAANIHATRGLVFSQKVLLELIDRGLSREDAYAAVQAAAMRCWNGGADFITELLAEPAVASGYDRAALESMMDVQAYLAHVPAIFARCGVPLEDGA